MKIFGILAITLGLSVLLGGFLVNLPQENYVWFVADLILGPTNIVVGIILIKISTSHA